MRRSIRRWRQWFAWGSVNWSLVKRVVGVGLTMFVVGYLLTAVLFFRGGSRNVVTVPDVRRMSLAQARRALERVNLSLELGDSMAHERVRRGAVLIQTPLPGEETAPETRVRVILSRGRERRNVPAVTALNPDRAMQLLQAYGFRVTVQEVVDLRDKGQIVGTQPAAGTVAEVPGAIRLLISTGPPKVAVPQVVGLSEGDARTALDAAGLRVGELEREFRPYDDEGKVIAQYPQPGDSITMGRSVHLWVSTQQLLGVPLEEPEAEPMILIPEGMENEV